MKPGDCLAKEKRGGGGAGGRGEKAIGKTVKAQLCPFPKLEKISLSAHARNSEAVTYRQRSVRQN